MISTVLSVLTLTCGILFIVSIVLANRLSHVITDKWGKRIYRILFYVLLTCLIPFGLLGRCGRDLVREEVGTVTIRYQEKDLPDLAVKGIEVFPSTKTLLADTVYHATVTVENIGEIASAESLLCINFWGNATHATVPSLAPGESWKVVRQSLPITPNPELRYGVTARVNDDFRVTEKQVGNNSYIGPILDGA